MCKTGPYTHCPYCGNMMALPRTNRLLDRIRACPSCNHTYSVLYGPADRVPTARKKAADPITPGERF